jgi:hypothetical protein
MSRPPNRLKRNARWHTTKHPGRTGGAVLTEEAEAEGNKFPLSTKAKIQFPHTFGVLIPSAEKRDKECTLPTQLGIVPIKIEPFRTLASKPCPVHGLTIHLKAIPKAKVNPETDTKTTGPERANPKELPGRSVEYAIATTTGHAPS